jgi:hypothetical protein
LVGHPSLGLHGHCGTIFTTLNVVPAHFLLLENVQIGNLLVPPMLMQANTNNHFFLRIKISIECETFFAKTPL